MTKSEIIFEIRNWVSDLIPLLHGTYSFQQLYPLLRSLYNNNEAWDTWYQTEACGTWMTRKAILKAVKDQKGVTKVSPGVYAFNWY